MLFLCSFLFLGERLFILCHWNALLFNIVLIIYYIFLKKASIVFQTNFPAPKIFRTVPSARNRSPLSLLRFSVLTFFPEPFYILLKGLSINRPGQSEAGCCFCWGPYINNVWIANFLLHYPFLAWQKSYFLLYCDWSRHEVSLDRAIAARLGEEVIGLLFIVIKHTCVSCRIIIYCVHKIYIYI